MNSSRRTLLFTCHSFPPLAPLILIPKNSSPPRPLYRTADTFSPDSSRLSHLLLPSVTYPETGSCQISQAPLSPRMKSTNSWLRANSQDGPCRYRMRPGVCGLWQYYCKLSLTKWCLKSPKICPGDKRLQMMTHTAKTFWQNTSQSNGWTDETTKYGFN